AQTPQATQKVARFTEMKCLFRGNAVTRRQFTITLGNRKAGTLALGSLCREDNGAAQCAAAGKHAQRRDRRARSDYLRMAGRERDNPYAPREWRGRGFEPGSSGRLALLSDPEAMDQFDDHASQFGRVPFRTPDRRKNQRRRGPRNAGVLALLGAGDQAAGQARRCGESGATPFYRRSARYGAGAERFH